MKKVVFVLGPTASGKSSLALKIAQETLTPIINADSIQVYKGLEIGSSAPTTEEKSKAPHHLYNFVEKGVLFTAAHHLRSVKELLDKNSEQKKWILCGGSGFYLQALDKGMVPLSEATPEMKQRVLQFIEENGWEAAHAVVAQTHGDKIHLNDHYRIQRALEVLEVRKQPNPVNDAETLASPFRDFEVLKIGLRADKEILRQRVEKRIREMLQQGFIEEVQGLLDSGNADWAPVQSVGYFEVGEFLAGRLPERDLVEKITISTMQLIKKQMTWFKRDPDIRWFTLGTEAEALTTAKTWLAP